ncbi:MAG: hypothetical protein ACFFBV_11815 [Promethearchaeota archaeon]
MSERNACRARWPHSHRSSSVGNTRANSPIGQATFHLLDSRISSRAISIFRLAPLLFGS